MYVQIIFIRNKCVFHLSSQGIDVLCLSTETGSYFTAESRSIVIDSNNNTPRQGSLRLWDLLYAQAPSTYSYTLIVNVIENVKRRTRLTRAVR